MEFQGDAGSIIIFRPFIEGWMVALDYMPNIVNTNLIVFRAGMDYPTIWCMAMIRKMHMDKGDGSLSLDDICRNLAAEVTEKLKEWIVDHPNGEEMHGVLIVADRRDTMSARKIVVQSRANTGEVTLMHTCITREVVGDAAAQLARHVEAMMPSDNEETAKSATIEAIQVGVEVVPSDNREFWIVVSGGPDKVWGVVKRQKLRN